MTDRKRGGFTLIEILIVAVVLGILSGIALPNLTRALHQADAAKVVSDVRSIEFAVLAHIEDTGQLPGRGAWGTLPPDLTDYLPENMPFTYKDVRYRLNVNQRRGRVRLQVRYPRGSPLGEALKTFRRPGEVTWNARTTTFILDPE